MNLGLPEILGILLVVIILFGVGRISKIGGELRRYQHYRGEPVGTFTGWRPAMPVTQWVAVKP